MFGVFYFGWPYFGDYPLVGEPPVPPVLEEELKGGRRIYDPDERRKKRDDEKLVYEALDRKTIHALWPPKPAQPQPARIVAQAVPAPVSAHAESAEPEGLDPALVAAVMAAFDEDLI